MDKSIRGAGAPMRNHRTRIAMVGFAAGALISMTPHAEVAPVMTLDPGMHTGPIRRIAFDAGETVLATASDDKSARLWDVASARLLATLRPPVGPDQIGRLYGVAISRNNRIAVAGTSAAQGGAHRIYLFDLASHAYVKSFDARGGDIKRLEWSPDGKLLVAVYAGSPAMRVFDEQGALVFAESFSGDAYYATFASTQRLAVSASDGKIHFYSVTGNHVIADGTIVTSLNDPRGVNFSPDGKLLVVGYLSRQGRSVRVDVFDVASRGLFRSFSFSDIAEGNLMNVVWQHDGRAFYAGGTGYRGKNRFIVKRMSWPDGKVVDIESATNSILDLAALKDGRIAFATAEPTWGLIEGDRIVKTVSTPTAQFYDASRLQINDDASKVGWSYRPDDDLVHFDLRDRQVRDGPGDAKNLPEPSTWKVRISDWENGFHPKINGVSIALEPTEVARASALLPGAAGVILGSSRSLRRIDPSGKEIWALPGATEVRAVNVTADGKVVVAAMLDGTIRWRRASDGALLMSLFTTRDRKWVIWTESGYFDVSAGAENLTGWLVNRSDGEQADYFALSRFREKYFRPDVIDRVLRTGDAGLALADANAERVARASAVDERVRQRVEVLIAPPPVETVLPPIVALLSPAAVESSETRVVVDYTLFSPRASPITSFAVRVDGRPYEEFVNQAPSGPGDAAVGKLTLTLPERDSRIQIFAGNTSGLSDPATVDFRWRAPQKPLPLPAVTDTRPRLFLLGVGVSRYSNPGYNLAFAAKDATDFVQTLRGQNGKLYREVEVRLLVDERATRVAILEGLRWLKSVTTPEDVGILYLAGHGLNDVDETYYFLPHDVDLEHLGSTAVGEEAFREALSTMRGKSIFFVDTCYSGKVIGAFSNLDLTRISNRLSSPEYGIIVFSGSHGKQESMESAAWGNGAFTKALVDGLIGQADYRNEGVVTYKGLDYFVSDAVKKITSGLQTPVTTVPLGLGDFSLAKVLRDGK